MCGGVGGGGGGGGGWGEGAGQPPPFPFRQKRRFPEITGKDNLTVFSYSGGVKSPEWRRQLRRADLQQF